MTISATQAEIRDQGPLSAQPCANRVFVSEWIRIVCGDSGRKAMKESALQVRILLPVTFTRHGVLITSQTAVRRILISSIHPIVLLRTPYLPNHPSFAVSMMRTHLCLMQFSFKNFPASLS